MKRIREWLLVFLAIPIGVQALVGLIPLLSPVALAILIVIIVIAALIIPARG